MDVTRMLEADHRDVEDLIAKLETTEGKARMPLVEELVSSLLAHMALEEEVVYPAIEGVTGSKLIEEGENEHELARKALKEVQRMAPDTPGFGAALAEVKAGIEHHVKDEEDEVFPKAREGAPRKLEDIATPFMKKRMELGMPMTADGLAAASSKDELAAEARQAGIDGAGTMTKDALAEALAAQMA